MFNNGKPHRSKLALYRGVAPKARIISLKVLDRNGAGYTSSVLQRARVRDRESRQTEDRHHQSVARPPGLRIARHRPARARGRGCGSRRDRRGRRRRVTTACNQETGEVGYAGITSPGNAPSAITVGALDTHDTIDRGDDIVAPYSSRGPAWYSGLAKPDIVAPGHRLVAVGAYGGSLYQQHQRTPRLGQGQDEEGAVSAPERHQHGGRSHERRRRADDPGEPRRRRQRR